MLCLGKGAQIALGLGWFERALNMSVAAVEQAECLEAIGNDSGVVDDSVRENNWRRVGLGSGTRFGVMKKLVWSQVVFVVLFFCLVFPILVSMFSPPH